MKREPEFCTGQMGLTMNIRLNIAACAASTLLAASAAQAAPVLFSGVDFGASSPGAQSVAAKAAFLASTGPLQVLDFESASLPAGVTEVGGLRISSPSGPARYWGGNTTPGGSYWLEYGGPDTLTFNFSTAISAFGLYIGGLQFVNTLSWTDSQGVQTAQIEADHNGGYSFLGFTDLGQSITSVTLSSPIDSNGLDDVLFGNPGRGGAVPEPASWALMIGGLGLAGAALRRRRATAFA